MIAVKRYEDGKYRVEIFEERHSHELVSPSKRHFQNGNRNVNATAKRALLTCSRVNIGPSQTYHLLREQVGGYSNIGCTQKDLQNFQTELKTLIKDSDAQIFVDKLKIRKELDPTFFYATQIDEEERLKNVFWADGICRKNYAVFGDVVSFDSTYNTNKYRLIFAPFTGINHHKSCVSFGVALLANEQIETYTWLFEKFLEAMEGVQPKLIVTDEDASMKVAIENVFKHSKHRLCMWHILKKLPLKVNGALQAEKDFHNRFLSCVWDSEVPEEFENSWKAIISEYGLQENKWLKGKFEDRDEWIPAYMKDVLFSGLMRTTSRSESENAFFKWFVNHKLSLVEFWIKFENALEKQRHKENQLDYETINKMLELKTNSCFEKKARDVFTHEAFHIFQHEDMSSFFGCIPKGYKEEGLVKVHTIGESSNSKRREVHYDASSGIVKCSCKLFELKGIPCRHILAVLRYEEVNELPTNLVLDRWTKQVNRKPVYDLDGHALGAHSFSNPMTRDVSNAFSNFHRCMNIAGENNERVKTISKRLLDLEQEWVSSQSRDKAQELESHFGCRVPDEIEIHPPNQVRAKGSKRLKGGLEEALERKKKAMRKCSSCGKRDHDIRKCPTKEIGNCRLECSPDAHADGMT